MALSLQWEGCEAISHLGVILSSVAYQPLNGGETDDVESGEGLSKPELPYLPRSLLPGLFARLSLADKEQVLRYKLLPVACLPHLTLYGAAGEAACLAAEEKGLHVVARILPGDFRAAIRGSLGRELLAKATDGLKRTQPALSAHRRLTGQQLVWVVMIAVWGGVFAALLRTEYFYALISLLCGIFFLSVIALKLFTILDENTAPTHKSRDIYDEELPVYSVLVPVFRETRVLDQLVAALSQLNYPIAKLDIKIIVEESDIQMHRAISCLHLPEHFDIIIVPQGKPQTKPRALNYALQFARGQLLTIYDAEDIPEPMQLRKAAARFAAEAEALACLQAELAFYNPNENWLARQFTVEYATLFKTLLPCLARENLPLLLGGTSNHFRTSILRKVGAWDPYNMTEDADLGLRLARQGYRVSVLDSVTYEEANTELGNWTLQRARWLKGFLQTWLVHMRHPLALIKDIGWDGFWVMNAMTFGVVVSALFHPFLIAHALYILWSGELTGQAVSIEMMSLASLNLVVLFCGYSFAIYASYKALRIKKITGWWRVLMTMPVYWVLMTAAGWMAVWQFIVTPFYWNKTRHGLSSFQKDRANRQE
jgi:glycosyltransferase XagB